MALSKPRWRYWAAAAFRVAVFGGAVGVITIASQGAADGESCVAFEAAQDDVAATCTTFLDQSGQIGTSCYWSFGFRDAAAVVFADGLWADVQMCHAGHALGADQLVNHPDSYDLRTWLTDDTTYNVSVKDKTQLAQTLVFLRMVDVD